MAESAEQNALEDYESRIPGGGSTYFYKRRDTKLPDGSVKRQVWCLGAGGIAATFDCVKNEGGIRKPVAIKQVALEQKAAERLEAYEFRGLSALSGRDHPNIVKFITFFKGDDGEGRVRLSFVFERCPTVVPYLVDAITNSKGFVVPSDDLVQPERDGCDLVVNPIRKPPLTLREALHVTRQLLSAVAYLHSAYPPIIHRDLKPDNVLIWGARVDPATGEMLFEVKITDYGTVRRADKRDLTLGQGTRSFMAPEVEVQTGEGQMAGKDARPTAQYDASVDVFSVGATFFYLLSSQAPHSNTRMPWFARFGGETGVESKKMAKWTARRDEKRAADKAKAAAAAAANASSLGTGGQAGGEAGKEEFESNKERQGAMPKIDETGGNAPDSTWVVLGGTGRPPVAPGSVVCSTTPSSANTAPRMDSPSPARPPAPMLGGAGMVGESTRLLLGAMRRSSDTAPSPAQTSSATPSPSRPGSQSSSSSSAGGMTTILDYLLPPGSKERVFLEGLVVSAPDGEGASEGASGQGSLGRRWTAKEALAWLDNTWPEIKEGQPLPVPTSVQ